MPKDDSLDSDDQALAASVGRCITRHREAEGLSMAELARRAGMSRAYLWRVEQGNALPGLRNIARISVALDVPMARLLEGADTSAIKLVNRSYDTDD
ncbi:helix-turn-helix transcriptional regulator [Citromicrobium bathyomarinum]